MKLVCLKLTALNLESFKLTLLKMDLSIKRLTTTDYGNGYNSYSGLTGEGMVEIISGLMCAVDEEIVG